MKDVNEGKFSMLTVLVASLIVLLALLAVLQYRWQGQISEAESARMRTNLLAATNRFAEDFDRELAGAYFGLQMDAAVLENENWAEYARRYDAWAESAAHPRIVKNISLAQIDGNQNWRLSSFNRATKNFEPVEQSLESNGLSEHLKNQFKDADFDSSKFAQPFLPPIIETVPALVAPVISVKPSFLPGERVSAHASPQIITNYVVITLDLAQIKQELLPALARRYFWGANELDYNFAVFKRGSPASAIYKSDSETKDREILECDAEAGIFKIRLFGAGSLIPENFNQALPTTMPKNEMTPKQLPLSAPPPDSNQITLRPASPEEQNGVWRLVVKHRGGSLEAVVETARRRNLMISFGVLGLLAASAAMIILTAKRAQRLARRQTEFAANVSHEFRTPLAVIILAGENLADGIVDVSPEARSYGTVIKDEARRLTETIEQVLELSAGQAGKIYERKSVKVAAVLENALDLCRGQIEENEFEIEKIVPESLPPLMANEAALIRAVQNLISNSIKYSNGSRTVKIRADYNINRTGNEIVITVEDKGIGIQSGELDDIFEPFARGSEAVKRQIHGNGLGLTLVKRIVAAHGGRISVRSALGRGSQFSLHLPVKRNSNGK